MKHGIDTVEVQTGPVPILDVASAIVGAFGTATTASPGDIVKTLTLDDAKTKLGAGSLLDNLSRIYKYSPSATVLSFVLAAPTPARSDNEESDQVKSDKTAPAKAAPVSVLNAKDDAELGEQQEALELEQQMKSDPLFAAFIAALPKIRTTQMLFGFLPKIFIAPGIIDKPGAALQAIAAISKTRGVWITEPPAGSTQEEAKAFANGISDYRGLCYYPRLKVVRDNGDTELDWAAPSYAGLIVKMDKNLMGENIPTGYWCSPSNFILVDAVGSEFDYDYFPSDFDCIVNQLNAEGIITTINYNGIRAFGNRSTAYPSKSDAMTFTSWRRTFDMIQEAIEQFTMQFLDRPMFTQPDDFANTLIGRVAESVNDYLRGKVGESIVFGECYIKEDQNPLGELMQGKIKFHYKATPCMAMESVEFESEIYVKGLEDALSQLLGGNA
ncbi:phage tail sheath family protein [Photobacterium piscicola]|uniref:phage tail sheath family protein n=1 Tax=Photobacterium piscicola TaxID=1378299 RepID=UPI0037364112